MSIHLDTVETADKLEEASIVEEYTEEDGEVKLRYKTFTPAYDERGYLTFNVSELDSETLFSMDEDNEQLFW